MITHLSTSSSDTDITLTELSSIQLEVLPRLRPASLYHDHDYRDHDHEAMDMMAVRSFLQFLAYSCCPVDVHVLSSLAGLGWQLEQDQNGNWNWTALPVQTPDTNYKLSDIRYQLLVNIPLIPAISYHNLNISDGLFSQLQLQLVVLLVEADHISQLNVVKREGGRESGRLGDWEGGQDTLIVGRIKIYFGNK